MDDGREISLAAIFPEIRVAVTAGASTPEIIVQGVREQLKKQGNSTFKWLAVKANTSNFVYPPRYCNFHYAALNK